MRFAEELLVQPDPSLYNYINQGVLEIDKVDDGEEMRATDQAFDILGFTQVKIFCHDKITYTLLKFF